MIFANRILVSFCNAILFGMDKTCENCGRACDELKSLLPLVDLHVCEACFSACQRGAMNVLFVYKRLGGVDAT